jgi:DNA-binding NtrC family response regulator
LAAEDEFDTVERPARGSSEQRGLCLMVSGEGVFKTYPLPDHGQVLVGRSSECNIRISHPSVSRRHAMLHLDRRIEIEDLGGANGVRVQDQKLPANGRRAIAIGEMVELGEVMLVVRRALAGVRPRRVWAHGYFEGRLEEQCARAERSNASFAVLRMGIEVPPPPDVIESAFTVALRALDVLALYAPGEYEVLLADTQPEDAEQVARRLVQFIEAEGGRVRVGLAFHPRDGLTPESLIARACDAVSGLDTAEPVRPEPPANGSSASMKALRRLTEKVAQSDLSALILGETGVGKEVLAETLHRQSPRSKGPFVRLHCAAFSESLLESELFGHERGAFTGADRAKPGLLETADGGTVLLDEIGELSLSTQVKLLRVLEERKVMRIGALAPRAIDVRFVAATNRDLEAEVALGRFRLDLYYRLNGMTLVIPPLRERLDEIESLARTFIEQACRRMKRSPVPALSTEALRRLQAYSWPGNIRELRNTIERALLLCGRGPIGVEHLSTEKMGVTLAQPTPPARTRDSQRSFPPVNAFDANDSTSTAPVPRVPAASLSEPPTLPPTTPVALQDELAGLERQRILDTLEQCGGNQSRAARQLGISRGTLIARLEAYGIPRPRKPQ